MQTEFENRGLFESGDYSSIPLRTALEQLVA